MMDEDDITEEMIQAGVEALFDYQNAVPDEDLVTRIFWAMLETAP